VTATGPPPGDEAATARSATGRAPGHEAAMARSATGTAPGPLRLLVASVMAAAVLGGLTIAAWWPGAEGQAWPLRHRTAASCSG
jgi:hypothetical protein